MDLLIFVLVSFFLFLHICHGKEENLALEEGNAYRPQFNTSLVLLISFDGFRWDFLHRNVTPTFLEIASNGGFANYTQDVFITKTFPNHITLVTGLYEESHGIVGNHMYDPVFNETFTLSTLDPKWWKQGEPVWITNQKKGGRSGVLNYPAGDVKYDGLAADFRYPQYSPNIPFDIRSDLMINLFQNGSINFGALYFEEPDHTGHVSGPESEELNEALKKCDNAIKHLMTRVQEAGLEEKLNIIITSDHGMVSTDESKLLFAEDYINTTRYKYLATDNNPVLGIFPSNESETDAIISQLQNMPHTSVFKKEDVPKERHYTNNRRIPPIVVVADEGWMILANKNNDKIKKWKAYKGEHGYNNTLPSMHPFFMTTGPAFKKGGTVPPFSSVDVYPLMCYLLGIEPRPNNGSLQDTIDLLVAHHVQDSKAPNPETHPTKIIEPVVNENSAFMSIGLGIACSIGLLAILLVISMCVKQRSYRQSPVAYQIVEETDVFEGGLVDDMDGYEKQLPNTHI